MSEKGISYDKWESKIKGRSDLTLFLNHLTKPNQKLSEIRNSLKNKNDKDEFKKAVYEASVDNLIKILKDETLYGVNNRPIKGTIPVVCFQETPWNVLSEVETEVWKEVTENTKLRYCGVGIAFHKFFLYEKGARPVIYDNRYDFLKERLRYNEPDEDFINNQSKYLKKQVTSSGEKIYENNNYSNYIKTEYRGLVFLKKINSLYESLYKSNIFNINQDIKALGEWWYEDIIKLEYKELDVEQKEKFDKIKNQIREGIFPKIKKNELDEYSLIKEQIDLLEKLFEVIFEINDKQIKEYKYYIKEEIDDYKKRYFEYKVNILNGEDFLWRLVEFELKKGTKDISQSIIDFTFEREWRMKNNLRFSLEEMINESNKMVLIFPNKEIYQYFKSKVVMEDKLEILKDINKYNQYNQERGISYIILDEYIQINKKEFISSFMLKISDFMRDEGINEDVIEVILNRLKTG